MATLHSVPGRWACALLLHISACTAWQQILVTPSAQQHSIIFLVKENRKSAEVLCRLCTVGERNPVTCKCQFSEGCKEGPNLLHALVQPTVYDIASNSGISV